MSIFFQGILALSLVFLCYYTAKSFLSLAPWVPMRRSDLGRLGRLANLKRGEHFFDLGSGDGRTVFHLARFCPGCTAWGIELFWPAFLYARLKQALSGPANAHFRWADAMKIDWQEADAVFLFAMPESLAGRIKDKLTELKPGSRVITYSFAIPDWKPIAIDKPTDQDLAIYLYVI